MIDSIRNDRTFFGVRRMPTTVRSATCLCLIWLNLSGVRPIAGADQMPSPGLAEALEAWREIPTLEDGRVMPLDTFARRHVETICHVVSPQLATAPNGGFVRWQADELVLDWLVQPDAWEDVPFLIAEHEELRAILELPVFETEAGNTRRLKHASPADVADSQPLRQRLIDIDERRRTARVAGEQIRLEGVDAKVDQLWQAYVAWRQLTFRASHDGIGRSRFVQGFEDLATAWKPIRTQLLTASQAATTDESADVTPVETIQEMDAGLVSLAESIGQSTRFQTADALLRIQNIQKVFSRIEGSMESPPTTNPADFTSMQRSLRRLGDRLTVLGESLYDNGGGLLVVPALHGQSLEAERNAGEDMPPWLALSAVLDAPESLLAGYPSQRVQAVREAFASLSKSVLEKQKGKVRLADAKTASDQVAASLRSLGESVEPLRRKLPVQRVDADLLRYTAYPAVGRTHSEVAYNQNDPFRLSWVLSFLAMGAFALAFGRARGPMFWLGTSLLICELVWTATAFASRIAITGWAPVTNMYETVIYVPFFLSLLGLFFLLAPACGRGVHDAWRLTAMPPLLSPRMAREAAPSDPFQPRAKGESMWNLLNWLLLGPRIAGSGLVLWVLAMAPYAAGGRTIINLLPQADIDRLIPNLNNLVVWIVGISMLAPAVWYLPRVALTAMVSIITVPRSLAGGFLRTVLPDVYARQSFGLVVTAVAFAGTFIAWFFPIPGKQFSPLQPVLRDNFWLTIHVLTIVSSYAAGALAWGLGCLSLGYYLLGSYRPSAPGSGRGKGPPEACASLAGFIYKAMQVAVLLLAAGTILGGLWADVSWGRFWGWDPKEVWALVSLLAYLVILHGRYAGWIGNFGLAAGSVLGAAVIGMSWYGVNFLLGAGLHSYGFGQGGQTEFFLFLVANFLLLGGAAWRYTRETADRAAAARPASQA